MPVYNDLSRISIDSRLATGLRVPRAWIRVILPVHTMIVHHMHRNTWMRICECMPVYNDLSWILMGSCLAISIGVNLHILVHHKRRNMRFCENMPVFNNILRILIILRLAILANINFHHKQMAVVLVRVEDMKPVRVSQIIRVLRRVHLHHTHCTRRNIRMWICEYMPVL